MSSNLSEHDPYRKMETANEGIRPEFLGGKKDDVDSNNNVEPNDSDQNARNGGTGSESKDFVNKSAQNALKKKEEEATKGLYKPGDGKDGSKKESNTEKNDKLASGAKGLLGGKSFSAKGVLIKFSAVFIIILAVIGFVYFLLRLPALIIANLDFNLMDSMGFSATGEVLKEMSQYVTEEWAKKGELPANYANDLVASGLDVGQITAAGDFVRTSKYIANIEDLKDLAVVGSGIQVHGGEGELAFMFDGEVILADDFVETVDANPRLFAAFAKGTNIVAKYYYGNDVNKVYSTLGLSRSAFDGWASTGDPKKDFENFQEILNSTLDSNETSVSGAAYDCGVSEVTDDEGNQVLDDEGNSTWAAGCGDSVSISGDADKIIGGFGKQNKSAAQLLSTALSSVEKTRTMKAFLAIEEPIQKTRIYGTGPANEVMTMLSDDSKSVTYEDVQTGETKTKSTSILNTQNFAAAASRGEHSKSEAINFSRDRILIATNTSSVAVKKTELSTSGGKSAKIGVGKDDSSADLNKAKSSLNIGISESNSELFPTIVGGNYILAGGSDLRSTIDMKALTAMPATQNMMVAYSHKADELLAKRAAAERATKSPFDISSPYTFMGSIAHGFASAMMRNRFTSSPSAMFTAAGTLVGDSAKQLVGGAIADGEGKTMLNTFGNGCMSVKSVSAAGDLYCSQMSAINTSAMDYTEEDWDNYWDNIEDDDIHSYENIVKNAADRWSTIGVKDAEICKKQEKGGIILQLFRGLFGECFHVDDGVATGSDYVMNSNSSRVGMASAYGLYDTVKSLLSEKKSRSSLILEEYYAEHPMDTSPAGRIALLSGMTKKEAETALAYAGYLNMIANYDASSRYAFGGSFKMSAKPIIIEHSERTTGDLFCLWQKQTEYSDIRNRSFAA